MRSVRRSSSSRISFPVSRPIGTTVACAVTAPRDSETTFSLAGDQDSGQTFLNPTIDDTPELAVFVPPGFDATQITVDRPAGQGGPFTVPRSRIETINGNQYAIFDVATALDPGTYAVTITGTSPLGAETASGSITVIAPLTTYSTFDGVAYTDHNGVAYTTGS